MKCDACLAEESVAYVAVEPFLSSELATEAAVCRGCMAKILEVINGKERDDWGCLDGS